MRFTSGGREGNIHKGKKLMQKKRLICLIHLKGTKKVLRNYIMIKGDKRLKDLLIILIDIGLLINIGMKKKK